MTIRTTTLKATLTCDADGCLSALSILAALDSHGLASALAFEARAFGWYVGTRTPNCDRCPTHRDRGVTP